MLDPAQTGPASTDACWLRLGCVAMPRSAVFCRPATQNHKKYWLFRSLDSALNLRVLGSIPRRLTSLRSRSRRRPSARVLAKADCQRASAGFAPSMSAHDPGHRMGVAVSAASDELNLLLIAPLASMQPCSFAFAVSTRSCVGDVTTRGTILPELKPDTYVLDGARTVGGSIADQ